MACRKRTLVRGKNYPEQKIVSLQSRRSKRVITSVPRLTWRGALQGGGQADHVGDHFLLTRGGETPLLADKWFTTTEAKPGSW